MKRVDCILGVLLMIALTTASPATADGETMADIDRGTPVHAITQYGDPPKYPHGFPHWKYVNPNAPRGGAIKFGAFGSFDSLNGMIMRGEEADGLGLIYDSLTTGNSDEVAVAYGNLAESIEFAEDRSWIIYNLRRDAYFHDGHPITAEDVVWTHETLRSEGRPFYRTRFYNDVDSIEALDEFTVRFRFANTENRSLPLAIGSFSILPKHYWEERNFNETTLEPPLGSGPYRIANVNAGRSITYERVDDYWGNGLPQNIGTYNFDRITYEYYRDNTVRYEAFKGGEFDYLTVSDPQEWSTGFEGISAVDAGTLKMELLSSTDPENFSGFTFNLRRKTFQDPRVREALTQFYDFETSRRQIHYGFFQRAMSHFPNTELAATGLPQGRELEILDQFRDRMPDHIRERIFDQEFTLPTTDGSGNIRSNLRRAMALLADAGWGIEDGILTNAETGEPMTFELVYGSPTMEPTVLALVRNFERGGIRATPRFVDGSTWQNRIFDYDYDLFFGFKTAFYPPGAALRESYGSAVADIPGNYNLSGIKDPVLDALAELVISAESWESMVQATRALDRYVQWNFLTIPFYYDDSIRIAYWDMFDRPETRPKFGLAVLSTWWFDDSNPQALRENR